jgi:hypothetical protein
MPHSSARLWSSTSAELAKANQDMAVGSVTPFRPTGTVSLSAGTSSATVALAGGGDSIVVTNITASLAYVRFGADLSISASVTDMPVMANSKVMLSANALVNFAAAILTTGSGAILFTRGDGSYV